MTTLSLEAVRLQDLGPLVRVRFGLHPDHEDLLRESGETVHPPLDALAMVDTGSSVVVLEPGSFGRLGILPTESLWLTSPAGVRQSYPSYVGHLVLQGASGEVSVVARAVELGGLGHVGALLGRNVLAHGRFLYDGRSGACALVLRGVEVPMVPPVSEGASPI